jgi:hypothetical protein
LWLREHRRTLGSGVRPVRRRATLGCYPEKEIEVINRRVAGDTVVDMARRWETDVIDVEHDWLFIMIG